MILHSGDSITYNNMDFDSGNGTIVLNAATIAADGVLKLVCDGGVKAEYSIQKNTNGEQAKIICDSTYGNASVVGVHTVTYVYEGSQPLVLKSITHNEINRVYEEEASPTIQQLESSVVPISGEYTTGDEYVSVPDGTMLAVLETSLHTDRTKDAFLSFRVRSNGVASLNLHREQNSESFASILIPDTNGEWTFVSCNLCIDNVSLDELPYKLYLLYLSIDGLENQGASARNRVVVDIDYMDTAEANSAPYFTDISMEEYVYVGQPYTEQLKVKDADADDMEVTIIGMPEGMSLADNTISWNVNTAADATIYLSVSDGRATTTIEKTYHVAEDLDELIAAITKNYDTNVRYSSATKKTYETALENLRSQAENGSSDEILNAIKELREAVANLYSLDQYVNLDGPDNTTLQCLDMLSMSDIKVTTYSGGTTLLVDGTSYFKIITDDDPSNKSDFYAQNKGYGGYMEFDVGEGFAVSISDLYFNACTASSNDYKCLKGTHLEASMDGTNWTTITEEAVAQTGWQQVDVTNNNAYRYLRITNENAWWGVIGEVRLLGRVVETDDVVSEMLEHLKNQYDENADYTPSSQKAYLAALSNIENAINTGADSETIQDALSELQAAVDGLKLMNAYVELSVAEGATVKALDLAKMSDVTVTSYAWPNGPMTVVDGKSYLAVLMDEDQSNKRDFYAEKGGNKGYLQCDFGEDVGVVLTQVYFAGCTNKTDYTCLEGTYIAGSNDGEKWVSLTSDAEGSTDWQIKDVEDENAYRYIRITNDTNTWWGVVGEVRFLGKAVDTTVDEEKDKDWKEQIAASTVKYNESASYTSDSEQEYKAALEAVNACFAVNYRDEAAIESALERLEKAANALQSLDTYLNLPYKDGNVDCLDVIGTANVTVTAFNWSSKNSSVVEDKSYLEILMDGDQSNKKDFYEKEIDGKYGYGGYIQCDFGENMAIVLSKVAFAACTKGANDYKCLEGTYIAASNDGENWTPLTVTVPSGTQATMTAWQDFSVTDTTPYRYIRITNATNAWWGVVGEVRFFGKFIEVTESAVKAAILEEVEEATETDTLEEVEETTEQVTEEVTEDTSEVVTEEVMEDVSEVMMSENVKETTEEETEKPEEESEE